MSKERFEERQDSALYALSGKDEDVSGVESGDWFRHGLIEHWTKRKFGIHVHFLIVRPCGQLDTGYYCSRFERPREDLMRMNNAGRITNAHTKNRTANERRGRQHELTMLVDIVDFLNMPEPHGFRALPSMIWLQTLDNCKNATRDARHPALSVLPELRAGRVKGKLHSIDLRRQGASHQEHQVVERRSKLMRARPNVKSDPGGMSFSVSISIVYSPLASILPRRV